MSNTRQLAFHEYAEIFPMMDGEGFQKLKADIEENGLQQNIVLYEGKILDGRNRYTACKDLGKQFFTEQYAGDDALGYVMSLNLHRRHLTASQLAIVASRSDAIRKAEAEARKRYDENVGRPKKSVASMPPINSAKSRDEAAKQFKVSPRYITDAKFVQKHDPEMAQKVMDGGISIPKAVKQVREKIKPKPEPMDGTAAAVMPETSIIPGFDAKKWSRIMVKANEVSDLMRNLADSNFEESIEKSEQLIKQIKEIY